jgi:phosphate transport system permease protein
VETLIRLSAVSAILGLLLILIFIFREAFPLFTKPEARLEASLKNLFTATMWQPVGDVPKYALLPLAVGTFKVVFVALVVAVLLAVPAAVYVAEFARGRMREILKPAIEMLAGIPSVVMGFFALMILASLLQAVTHSAMRLNAANAGIAVGLAIVPTIFSVSEDALRAVPRSYREASLALGCNEWQTACFVTLPAAASGIWAGIVLGFGRAVGETMIVLMASGNAALSSPHLFESVRTFSATIAAELGEVVFGSPHYHVLFFLGALLFVITFTVNLLASLSVDRMRRRLAGAA